MMQINNQNHIDVSPGATPRPTGKQVSCVTSDRNHSQVISISPVVGGLTGENRLRGDAEIFGTTAHAAVRMHAVPVTGSFWAYCPNTKTSHFQHSKVAP